MTSVDVFHHDVPAERDFGYAQSIKSGELIHVSGQLSLDEEGEFRYADDFIAQARQHATATAEGNLAYFGDHQPVSTVLGVPELSFPGQVIEIGFIVDTKLPA
ncbi:RidA family protein [Streptomyces rimosus]|uniref:RidA family protein n=1 Tax=Streptomyces rimosus TaxID=1927 RepID=UPI00379EA044